MKEKNLRKIIIILGWIVLWHVAALIVDNGILMATPLQVMAELFSMLGDPGFYRTVGSSLLRIGCGFLAGFAAAVALAAVSSGHPLFEEALSPVMTLLKAIPVASFVVLLLIWWGSSFLAVAICFVVVLPNIYINMLEGLKSTDRQLLEMAQVFHVSVKDRFFYIYRPAIAPFLYSGMKISLGMCWKSGVAAEVIGTPDHSIGERLYLSKVYLDTAGVFAWTTIVILLSILFEKMILWMAGRFFKWEPACSGQVIPGRVPAGARGKNVCGRQAETLAASPDRLEASHICKSFGSQQVISDFSAVYEPGRTYVLNAPSGSGKTTLLHMLAGILEPDGGVVKGGGTCSMVFQEDRLCMDTSAVKNVEMVTGDPLRAKAALETLLEPEALQKPCRELSGGMKRRVALVRAMEAESDYVLLDEPFTGMDADTRARAEEYIRRKQNGRLVILVTHDRSRLGAENSSP
ncbi:MAG: ATP-binding cassette domain-containing protein [Blautia sp.]|nr:ATP-binding cassette domain-containing protein [Blautia sp.]